MKGQTEEQNKMGGRVKWKTNKNVIDKFNNQ